MSIAAMDNAIDADANVCLAIVSEKLFFQLDRLFRLKLVQMPVSFSEAALGEGLVRRFFRNVLQQTQQPVTFTYFVLEGAKRIRVELAASWDIRLDDDGPNSFLLASMTSITSTAGGQAAALPAPAGPG